MRASESYLKAVVTVLRNVAGQIRILENECQNASSVVLHIWLVMMDQSEFVVDRPFAYCSDAMLGFRFGARAKLFWRAGKP